MDTLLYVVQYILNLGAVSLLPILMTIFGMFFGMKLGRALKSGLLVGIGFQGLLLVTGHISTLLKPIVGYFKLAEQVSPLWTWDGHRWLLQHGPSRLLLL